MSEMISNFANPLNSSCNHRNDILYKTWNPLQTSTQPPSRYMLSVRAGYTITSGAQPRGQEGRPAAKETVWLLPYGVGSGPALISG